MPLVSTEPLPSKSLRACLLGVLLLGAALAASAQALITTVAGGKASDPSRSLNACTPIQAAAIHGADVYVVSCDRIYKVDALGVWTPVAGTGEFGFSGDGRPALNAALNQPKSISVDGSGNIFIEDHARIREVVAATGIIQTVAGTGTSGYNGDGMPAISAQIGCCDPTDPTVFADGSGNIFIADRFNHRVRKFTVGGNIQTIAGTGSFAGSLASGIDPLTALIAAPSAVFVDVPGNIFIADRSIVGGQRIWEIVAATGKIQTVAGGNGFGYSGDNGPATSAKLGDPRGLFVDGSNVYIAEYGNNVIREFTVGGNIKTVAGNGTLGFTGFNGDGGPATSAELNSPHEVFTDAVGNIFIVESFLGVREVVASTGKIQAFIANSAVGFSGEGGPAIDAQLFGPIGAVADSFGNIFLADQANNVIQEVVAATGLLQHVAGNHALGPGFSGDGLPANSAQLNQPAALFVDSLGNIFIADWINNVIREVVAATGLIQTVAGNFALGPGYSGDNGPAISAQLNGPDGVFVDSFGNIFIAEEFNNVVRKVDALTKTITTVAGNFALGPGYSGDSGPATSAQLNQPANLFVDGSGNIFIADVLNSRIREVVAATGKIQTVAGNGISGHAGDGGPATSAQLVGPSGVFGDTHGNLFISDYNSYTVRKFRVGGAIQTVAGTGIEGFSGDGGPAILAELNQIGSVFVEPNGNLVISDYGNGRIRVVVSPPQLVVTRSLSRDHSTNDIVVVATITNTGGAAASNVQLTVAKIGSTVTKTALPQLLGTIAAGSFAEVVVRFPGSAGSPGAASTVTLDGTYTGGSFAATARATLP